MNLNEAPTTGILLSRHEKEMGIQISEMEKYKYICSERNGMNVGKQAYFDWAQKYGKKVRDWLETLEDLEIDNLYNNISDQIKQHIVKKNHK